MSRDSSIPPASGSRGSPGSGRLWLFRLGAMTVVPLALLAFVEGILRLAGVGYPTTFFLPDPGDPGRVIENHRFGLQYFPDHLARTPDPLRFPRDKAEGARRVFVLGESAAMGDPEPAFGLSRVLAVLLERRHPGEDFEVINLAMTAINSHAVRRIAGEAAGLDADAWVIYMGNNEVIGPYGPGSAFAGRGLPGVLGATRRSLQRLRLGQALAGLVGRTPAPRRWTGIDLFREHPVAFDSPELAVAHARFEGNLGAILDMAEGKGVPVVLSTVAVNLEDCAPFHSDDGPASAEAAYREGRHARARDLDRLRVRADSRINAIIRRQGESRADAGVALVDAAESLTGRDAEFFWEHVHFRFAGNYALALLVAEALEEALGLPPGAPWADEAACAEALLLTGWHQREVARIILDRKRGSPFTAQFNHREDLGRLEAEIAALDAAATPERVAAASAAAEAGGGEWRRHELAGRLAQAGGDLEGARSHFREVAGRLPHSPRGPYLLGNLLDTGGRSREALAHFDEALRRRPDHPEALNGKGVALTGLGRHEEAEALFARALEKKPGFAIAEINWGYSLASRERHRAAARHYRRALEIDPASALGHFNLATCLATMGEREEALGHFRECLAHGGRYPRAHYELGVAAGERGSWTEAASHFEALVELAPGLPEARTRLEEARRRAGDAEGDPPR